MDYIFICYGKDCKKIGSKAVAREIKKKYKDLHIIKTKCVDHCKKGPLVFFRDSKFLKVSPEFVDQIISKK